MPPVVIDLSNTDDTRDVVHRAVQALAEGKIVAFPTETVYGLAASGLSEGAVERLLEMPGGSSVPTLAVKSAGDALDYAPDLGEMGRRLARRCWPGPVTLAVENHHPESLLRQLSPKVQQLVAAAGWIRLRVPAHPTLMDVLRLLAGPVVLSPAHLGGAEAVTAQEVVEALPDGIQLVLDGGRSRYGQRASVVEVGHDSFRVLEAGVVSEQTLKRLSSLIVMFVCTGNTCRSPMAETLFRKLAADRLNCTLAKLEERGVLVMSAGIAAMLGGRPSGEAVTVMAEAGLDLQPHESQPLTEALVRNADLILAMTRAHRQAILAEWPEAAERVRLVSHRGLDIADPVGGTTEQYRACAEQLRGELAQWVLEIPLK